MPKNLGGLRLLSAGLSETAKGVSDERAGRDQRRLEANQRNEELAKLEFRRTEDPETGQSPMEIEMEALKAQNQTIIATQNRDITFKALDGYNAAQLTGGTPDAHFLNQIPKYAPKAAGGYTRFDNLPTDPMELQRLGMTPRAIKAGQTKDGPKWVVGTRADGTQQVTDMRVIEAASGYTRWSTLQQAKVKGRTGVEPETVRLATAVGAAQQRMGTEEERPGDQALIDMHEKRIGGLDPGKIANAQEAAQSVLDVASNGDEEAFMAMDFGPGGANEGLRAELESKIVTMEKNLGQEFSKTEKESAQDINSLINLGKSAIMLDPANTGLIDNTVFNIAKYYESDIDQEKFEQLQSSAAMATFRNLTRNVLYGQTLTAGETKAFEEQMGTLRQQHPAIMAQMSTAFQKLSNDIRALGQFKHPYIAKYRLGGSIEQIKTVQDNIQKMLSLTADGATIDGLPKPPRKDLKSYFVNTRGAGQ